MTRYSSQPASSRNTSQKDRRRKKQEYTAGNGPARRLKRRTWRPCREYSPAEYIHIFCMRRTRVRFTVIASRTTRQSRASMRSASRVWSGWLASELKYNTASGRTGSRVCGYLEQSRDSETMLGSAAMTGKRKVGILSLDHAVHTQPSQLLREANTHASPP